MDASVTSAGKTDMVDLVIEDPLDPEDPLVNLTKALIPTAFDI